MADLKAAVVGTGSMGRNHARIYHDLPDTHLVAVVDVSEARRSQVAARHGCRHYGTLAEMLALESPDLVSIEIAPVGISVV